MRNLIGFFCLCVLAFACEKEETTFLPTNGVALELHAIVICGSTYDIGNETAEEWGQRIVDLVSADGITIVSFELDYVEVENPGFCGNCSRTGDILKVIAAEEDEEALRALGFVD
ncbi:hypothetical protein [Lewinella sp. LCG006]|uniref:hypothetical protein n=1 Tax=Lewinella sp. LCG006 TaxID=3231911 RepID=UPI00345F65D1